MAKCVQLLTNPAIAMEDGLTVSLPDICTKFERPLECPEVIVNVWLWTVNAGGISARMLLDIPSVIWHRFRETDEFGTSPGAWFPWVQTYENDLYQINQTAQVTLPYPAYPVAYDWYDVQFLIEPEGYGGWQEISPLCGGWWHLQTPMKDFPPVDPPIPIYPPEP